MNKKRPFAYLLVVSSVLALLAVVLLSLKKPQKTVLYGRILMGTAVEITLKQDNPRAVEAAFKEIERLEKVFSSYIPDSEISRISKGAGKEGIKVSAEVVEVVLAGLKVSRLSKGAFDPTVGVLFGKEGVWDFSGEKNNVPKRKEILRLLRLVDYRDVIVNKDTSIVGLKKRGMRLDLGGVAKGYIVGRAMEVLKKHGIEWAIIRAGGDMMVYSSKGNAPPFTIGIQHPRKEGELLGKIRVANRAVATSGDYERSFIKDGIRYHHIIDPKTGYPADKCRSVTVVSEDPTLADALSTAAFVMGPEKGMELIERLAGVEGIIVDREGGVGVSSGLKAHFERL